MPGKLTINRHEELRQRITDFFATFVLPYVEIWEQQRTLPIRQILQALAEHGLLGLRFPSAYAGHDGDIWTHVIFADELGRIPSGGVGIALTIHIDMVAPIIANHGTPEQCAAFLKPALEGKLLFTHAASETNAGSDIAAIETTATRENDGYRITGTKRYVLMGDEADYLCILARLPGRTFPFNMSIFLVDRVAQGVTVSPCHSTLGLYPCNTVDIAFEDVFVPVHQRIGAEGLGFAIQMSQFAQERIISAIRANASAAYHLEQLLKHCQARHTFGKPLLENQTVAAKLADLKMQIWLNQQLTVRAVETWIAAEKLDSLAAMSKLTSSRLAREVAHEGLLLFGAIGYQQQHPYGRYYRDSRLFSILTGSDEMMLSTISRELSTPEHWHQTSIAYQLATRQKRDLIALQKFRQLLHAFIDTSVVPFIEEWDEQRAYPLRAIVAQLGANGFLNCSFPTASGGRDLDRSYSVLLHEELAQLPCGSIGSAMLSHLDIATRIVERLGKPTLRQEWVPQALGGQKLLALALTETDAGSDLKNISSFASQRSDGNWSLSGKKTCITNAALADGYCVMAKTKIDQSLDSYTLFFVPATLPGVESVEGLDSLGQRGSLGTVTFNNVVLPPEYVLGKPGAGLLLQLRQFDYERTMIAVRMVAMAQFHFNLMVAHCQQRQTFGQPLLANQYIQFALARLKSELMRARLFTLKTLERLLAGETVTEEAAAAKLTGSRLVFSVADMFIQLSGGAGYMEKHPAARFFRDAPGLAIAGGGDAIMLTIIGRDNFR